MSLGLRYIADAKLIQGPGEMRRGDSLASVVAAILTAAAASALAEAEPVPPCLGPDQAPVPAYATLGAEPNVGLWHDVSLDFSGACPDALNGPASLVVALSGRFHHDGAVAELAARIGSVSTLEGLPYWSVSDGRWRPLVTMSHAIVGPASAERRADFTARDILSGETLYMAKRDTRSHGLNVYTLQAISPAEDQLVVTTTNLSAIRFLFATLFEPPALVSTLVFTRLHGNEWGYYSFMVVKEGGVRGREASLINRAAAFGRLFTGQRPDAEPPFAR